MRNKNWTISDIPDLTGKRIIVTGGNSGIGFETAKALAAKNAEVIIAGRDKLKGEEAARVIKKEFGFANIRALVLDLMDLKSVLHFAEDFRKEYKSLDVLINNAGIMMAPYNLTKDGFESQFGVNHLGHFALTGLLMDIIKYTPYSRVVNVSSVAHKYGDMDFSNLLYREGKDYNSIKAYGRSKLANLLFTYELQRYFEKNKINSIAVAAHPGSSNTNLVRYIEKKFLFKLFKPFFYILRQSPDKGALPQLRAAVDVGVKGGEYYGPAGINELSGPPIIVKSNKASHKENDAKRLWEESERLTGIVFPK